MSVGYRMLLLAGIMCVVATMSVLAQTKVRVPTQDCASLVVYNPAPDVAGLQFCLDELLAMKAGSAADQAYWRRFRAEGFRWRRPPIVAR